MDTNQNSITNNSLKILIAVLNQGSMRVDLNNMLIKMVENSPHKIRIYYPSVRPSENNRNQIVKLFLSGDWDYLMTIDNDTVPLRNPLDLIAFDKDIIGCVYPQWREGDVFWVVMDRVEGGYRQVPPKKREGLKKVDAVGTGCILIKRKVLEKMKAPFKRRWDEDGIQTLGLDFHFCERAKELGFGVWAHWDFMCSHYKEIDLVDIYKLLAKNSKEA